MAPVISRLLLYPVKGCRGFAVRSAQLASTGLEFNGVGDREWVVVDGEGEFLSQRELPRMALVETRLTASALRLAAPGMLTLEIPFESEGDVVRVRVWDDEIDAVTPAEEVLSTFDVLVRSGRTTAVLQSGAIQVCRRLPERERCALYRVGIRNQQAEADINAEYDRIRVQHEGKKGPTLISIGRAREMG